MSIIGLGVTIAVNDGSGGAASSAGVIVDVLNLTTSDPTVNVVESKRLNLTGRLIGKIQALTDPGTFEFQYEYSAGKKERLDPLLGVTMAWTFTMTDSWVRTVPGFIVSNKMDKVEADAIQTCTCTVQVNGASSGN